MPSRVYKKISSIPAISSYNPYLDVLKGVVILLVILGHSIQLHAGYQDKLPFRIIYSFHIPLFMFLSGAVASYGKNLFNFSILRKKFYALVVPFIAWGLLNFYFIGTHTDLFLPRFINGLFEFPDRGLWFLWVLFLNFCCLVLIKNIERFTKSISYILVWFIIYSVPFSKYGVGLVRWHLPFFLLGYLIFSNTWKINKYKKAVLAFCVLGFPILVASWHWITLPPKLVNLSTHLAAHGLLNISLGDAFQVNTYRLIILFYMYLVPLTGIGFMYSLLLFKPLHRLHKFFTFFGKYTMELYVLFWYFLHLGFGIYWLNVISSFVISTLASILLGRYVFRRFNWLNRVFLGGRKATPSRALKRVKA
jgi:fucose 4-O-acetylase-like acetyltransferase